MKEFFRRVAAITFEQAILRELESQGARIGGGPQIGTGGVLSKYLHSYFIFPKNTVEKMPTYTAVIPVFGTEVRS